MWSVTTTLEGTGTDGAAIHRAPVFVRILWQVAIEICPHIKDCCMYYYGYF